MRPRGEVWTSVVGLLVVVGLYAASFFLPVLAIPLLDQVATDRAKAEIASRAGGGEVLAIEGPSVFVIQGHQAFHGSLFRDWAGVAWFANPVLWVGYLLFVARRWRWAALAGAVALVLGSAMVIIAVVGDPKADLRWSVADYRVGYWLWLGSMALLVLAAVVARRVSQNQRPSIAGPNQPLQQTAGA
jgi:hypothetical protein